MHNDSVYVEWVSRIKQAYPDVPNFLTLDLEEKHIETLRPWFERVRDNWGERAEEEDASLAQSNPYRTLDKGQMGPVLAALDPDEECDNPLSEEEQQAWHELFVTHSALMTRIADEYYPRFASHSSIMTREDVMQITAIAFFYALSAYDPDRESKEHAVDFSHRKNSRPRLITFITQEAPRHVRRYLEFYAYSIRKGSNHTYRLRANAYKWMDHYASRFGTTPNPSTLARYIDDNKESKTDEDTVTRLRSEGSLFLEGTPVDSLDITTGGNGTDTDASNESAVDRIEDHPDDAESFFDAMVYLEERVDGNVEAMVAIDKLINTDDELTTAECFVIGL